MKKKQGYSILPFSMKRRMVAATSTVGHGQNNIQALIEVDISEPQRIIQEHRQHTGEKLSLTAYVVKCLAQTVVAYPYFNSFRKGQRLIVLDDVTISILVEREIDGEFVPESFGIRAAQKKTYGQIHTAIRSAQGQEQQQFGNLSGVTWIRFIPSFLFRAFIRLASHNLSMMKRFGAIGVTAMGMFAPKNQPLWVIPLVGGATVAIAVGGIVERPSIVNEQLIAREHLCLTVTFNHDIVDGAPAARFVKTFSDHLKSGDLLDQYTHPYMPAIHSADRLIKGV